MATADTSAHTVRAAARFGRRSTRGVLFGLSRLRLATVAGAFVFGVVSLVTSGPGGVIGASPVWGGALLVAYVSVQGRSLLEWAPVVAQGAWAAPLSERPMKPRPAGTLALLAIWPGRGCWSMR